MILLGKSLTAILGGGGGGSSTFAGLSDKTTADIPTINTPTATALNAKEATSNKKTDVDANKTSDTFFPSVKAVFDWVSSLFVKGVTSSADNAIARFDGTTGKVLQSSNVTIDDGGILSVNNVVELNSSGFIGAYSEGGILAKFGQTSANLYAKQLIIENNPSIDAIHIRGIHQNVAHNQTLLLQYYGGSVCIGAITPTAAFDVAGTSRFRNHVTFNSAIIDNVGSAGADGQVLKKVDGLVLWSNP